jgi:hypothetical protein
MTGTPAARKAGSPGGTVPPKKPVPRFEFDRVIAMRVVFVVIVVLFLYMILRVSMIAFGGSAKRETKRIERAIDTSTVHVPAPVPGDATQTPARPAP